MLKNIKNKITLKNWAMSPIYIFSLSIFFWTVFDTILTYLAPLIMKNHGLSITTIGLIIGSSSIFGALFDFIIGKIFKNSNFRRLFMIMFILSMFYPLILWQAKTIPIFLIAMMIWGIYYDLYHFGVFNFIGRYTKKKDHAANFGILQTFRSLAIVIAPIFAGLVIVEVIDWRVFSYSWVFLIIGIALFIQLLTVVDHNNPVHHEKINIKRRRNPLIEIRLWKKLTKLMSPALFMTFYIYTVDAFFWTLIPLFNNGSNIIVYSGLFLAAYSLPPLFVSVFVGKITNKYGKKPTAIVSILMSSLVLSTFMLFDNPVILIGVIFISSCFISISLPAVSAIFADYISDSPSVDNEVESIEDLLTNLGYVVGPISAGILAGLFNISFAFSILGLVGIILAIVLIIVSPNDNKVRVTNRDIKSL